VALRLSRPEVPQELWAFGFTNVGETETAEDVETALGVFEILEDGMEAVLESVSLKELRAG